jgi:hypothetical protein
MRRRSSLWGGLPVFCCFRAVRYQQSGDEDIGMGRTRAAIAAAQRNGMAARRQQVAALLHAGFAQCAIAAQLGVSEATVSGDCAVLREQWRVAAAADYAEVVAAALAALDVDEAGVAGAEPQPRDRVAAQPKRGTAPGATDPWGLWRARSPVLYRARVLTRRKPTPAGKRGGRNREPRPAGKL